MKGQAALAAKAFSPAGVISWSWKGQRRTLAVAPDKIVITAAALKIVEERLK